MIFLFEQYLRNRRVKVRNWEQARAAYLAEDKYYHSKSIWLNKHPYPVLKWGNVFSWAIPVICVLAVAGTVATLAVNHNPKPTKTGTTQAQKNTNPNDCGTLVRKGQNVGVSYGSFQGSKGTVVQQREDCSVDITLTDSTNTFDQCKKSDDDSTCSGVQNNGSILHISRSDNVIPL